MALTPVRSQSDTIEFISRFLKANKPEKIRLFSSIAASNLKNYYPRIKDTVEKIKQELNEKKDCESRSQLTMLGKTEADLLLQTNEFDKAFVILQNALQYMACDVNDSLQCMILMKSCFVNMRLYTRAYQTELIVKKLWPRRNKTLGIYYGIKKSQLLPYFGLQNQALFERRKEFGESDEKGTLDTCTLYNDVGFIFYKQMQYDSAIYWYKKAVDILAHKKIDGKQKGYLNFFRGLVNGNMGACYLRKGKVDVAIPLFWDDINASLQAGYYESAYNSYVELLNAAISKKDLLLGQTAIDSATHLLKTRLLNNVINEIKLLPHMAKFCAVNGEFERSAKIYTRFVALNDSITLIEKQVEESNRNKALNIIQSENARYEHDKLERRIQLERAERRYYLAYVAGGILLLLLIITFLTINYRSSRKRELQLSQQNKQIRDQNVKIQQSLKEKESLFKEVEQFAYVASHDLREPLITMKSYISILDEDCGAELSPEGRQYIDTISRASERMETLIIALLDYSRLSRAKQLQEVQSDLLVKEVMKDLESLITSSGAVIHVGDLPTLNAYPIELKLLFQNLISNAIKFNKKDTTPIVEITAEQIPLGWKFCVKDNGIGIHESNREKIFEIFQRLHSRDEYHGTGIGLAHCKKIAEIHGGDIWVESIPDVSSSFYFTIQTQSL